MEGGRDMHIVGLYQIFDRILDIHESMIRKDWNGTEKLLETEFVYMLMAVSDCWPDSDDKETVAQCSKALISKMELVLKDRPESIGGIEITRNNGELISVENVLNNLKSTLE